MAVSSDPPDIVPGLVEIRTTVGSRESAAALAERLIVARLAACVQIDGPVTSTYRWQSAVETSEEWRCTCKTTAERQAACVTGILAAHEYQTPQVTIVAIAATAAYAAWVRASTSGS